MCGCAFNSRPAPTAAETEGGVMLFAPQALQRPSLDADPEPGNASLDAYSPKYLSAIWMPSSYIFWYSGWNCSPRFVPRWKNRITFAIGIRRGPMR
jgi:hypothetical protein